MSTTPDIVLYGGSFDPPHTGHGDCVRLVLKAFPDADLRVLPAYHPAAAAGASKTPVASYKDRVAMCERAFSSISERVTIETWEAELPHPNFTIRTLQHAAALFPGKRLGFLMGQDQLESFLLWKDPKAILDLATIVVVERHAPDKASSPDIKSSIDTLSEHLGHPATSIMTVPTDAAGVCPAASHVIRWHIAAGAAVPKGWLAPAVAHYIKDHHLYEDPDQHKDVATP